MTIVSKSGFIVKDVYEDLKSSMATQNYVRVCHLTAELLCSGEIKHLASWLVAMISNHYVTTNAFLLRFAATRLSAVKREQFKWKSDEVRKAVCELSLIFAKEPTTTSATAFYKPERKLSKENKTFVESQYFKPGKRFVELGDNLKYFSEDEDLFTTVCFMYEHMLKNDIKSVFKFMYHILQMKNMGACETLDIVRDVKRCKTDPVWLLWKVLFIYAERPPTDDKTKVYISSAFDIFAFDYNKQVREERLNLLFVCYLICVKRKGTSYDNTCDDVIQQACSRIHVVYEEILEKENTEKKLLRAAKTDEKKVVVGKDKREREKKTTSRLSDEERKALDEKMRYLFVMTYAKPKNDHLYSSARRTEPNVLPYKFVHVTGNGMKGLSGSGIGGENTLVKLGSSS